MPPRRLTTPPLAVSHTPRCAPRTSSACRESGANWTASAPFHPLPSGDRARAGHMRALPSSEPEITRSPSGLKRARRTGAVWPGSVASASAVLDAPDAREAVVVAGHHEVATRIELHRPQRRLAGKACEPIAAVGVPHLRDAVRERGDHAPPVTAEVQVLDRSALGCDPGQPPPALPDRQGA